MPEHHREDARKRWTAMKSNISSIRKERNMSQKELAIMAGVTRQTIGYLEHNQAAPSLDLAYRIARIFNLKIEDIFVYDDYTTPSTV
jgi:putative transcriptional regulator